MQYFKKSMSGKKIIAALLIVSLLAPSVFLFKPQKAEAYELTYDVGLNPLFITTIGPSTVENTATNILNTKANVTETARTNIWNGLFIAAIKIILTTMLNDIVTWAQNGFDGGPAFVQNPNQYLRNVGDVTAGAVIEEMTPFLCSPFRSSIIKNLSLDRTNSFDSISCTLTDVVGNVDDFINGNFNAGGWDGWFSMTQNKSNNPYGLYAKAKLEIAFRVSGEQTKEETLLDWGQGFFSWRECIQTGVNGECSQYGDVKTPGSVVESQINQALGSTGRQLEIADEINETVAAVAVALVNKLLTSGLSAIQ